MNKYFLVIMIFAFSIGVAGKLAYDAYPEPEQQNEWKQAPENRSCSSCTAIKQELKYMREQKARENDLKMQNETKQE